jgi:hypothetical protein
VIVDLFGVCAGDRIQVPGSDENLRAGMPLLHFYAVSL